MFTDKKNISSFSLKTGIAGLCMSAFILYACGPKKSAAREWINNPEHGYIEEVQGNGYTIKVQYQTPAYRADQEIMLNKSKESKKDLVAEYDQLQQFLLSYSDDGKNGDPDPYGLTECFSLYTNDTIPCIDVHTIGNNPGSTQHDMLILFPLTEKELGNQFSLIIKNFPGEGTRHSIKYSLTKK